MTCNLAGTLRPSWNRRTAGVVSAKRVRGARPEACCGERFVMWTDSSMEWLRGGWEITEVLVRHGSERRLLWNQFQRLTRSRVKLAGNNGSHIRPCCVHEEIDAFFRGKMKPAR